MRDIDYPRRAREYVDLARADQSLRDATNTWIVNDLELYEGDALLPGPTLVSVRASLPSDDSFRSYETALAHLTGPRLADDTEFVWNQGLLDVWLTYPIQSEASRFSINVRWGRLGVRTVTALRLIAPGGAIRAFELVGDPGLVRLDPRWHQAAIRFVVLGFFHILDGTDHLLFLLCLVIPFRRLRPLIAIVTSFTVAHSITLLASAYDLAPGALWFPPLIETLIATSIVYMAVENIVGSVDAPASAAVWGSGPSASEGTWGPDERKTTMDDRVRLWSGPRFRLLVRSSRNAAVRRISPPDLSRVLQRRRRARTDSRDRAARSRNRSAIPFRRRRKNGHDHSFGARRSHGVALDE